MNVLLVITWWVGWSNLERFWLGCVAAQVHEKAAYRPLSGHFCCHGIHIGGQTKRPVRQFQASLTKLGALLQVVVQFRYNI